MGSIFLRGKLVLLPSWRRIGGASMTQLHFLGNITPFVIRCFSSSKQHSFTVSYLINSCGLSTESAISTSKKVQFENPKNPDSVLTLLKNHGCNDTHISKIVAKLPLLLLANPEKTLLPKLQFLGSVGLSHVNLAKILASNPSILHRSLENNLIPTYNLLKGVVIGDENAAKAVVRHCWIPSEDLEKTIAPNVRLLREIGVPMAHISFLATFFSILAQKSDKFSKDVNKVMGMGFDPQKMVFVNALHVICQMSESNWYQKIKTYRRCGLSEDEIMLAFRNHPICFQLSEKKIISTMDYLVNMGSPPAAIARAPVALFFNLERRIVPRCSVVKLLLLKGLVKKYLCLGTFLNPTERAFLDRFIIKYQEDVPQLLDVYNGKVGIQELGLEMYEAVAAFGLGHCK
ncbi:hypothetical protein VitviT2T_009846 [Vitis vinifera]|uniref:Uncharacterized protein n=1 Tax=Vitis vinifera TaxID=29760 RepID=A0ABY9C6U4_VITVI|nr:transcription termination factor MTERF9, chloroplastic-like [Vitis vinifera]WJZ90719.1 hypothetical protein VitviT2T_009846 [Vitis vinifera]|eukprot:XP_002271628.1 PREDICTED: transcription termination factor MTERF9, chloroplastic-like [Vitis vinifera]